MTSTITGSADRGHGKQVAIVEATFHATLSQPLVEGACAALCAGGVMDSDITIVRVPGAFEIALAAQRLAEMKEFHAIICLGVVIRGETDHYEHVTRAAAHGIAEVGRRTGVPTIFGVITGDTIAQVVERSGGQHGNRGIEAARTALTMIDVLGKIGTGSSLSQAQSREPVPILNHDA